MRCRNILFQSSFGRRFKPNKFLYILREWQNTGRRPAIFQTFFQKQVIADNLNRPDAKSKLIVVKAVSSGFHSLNFAQISINDTILKIKKNENNHYRGLHIAVINPRTGKVVQARGFDTYKSSATFDAWIGKGVKKGRIIVVACKDDCWTALSEKGKSWFRNMGSK